MSDTERRPEGERTHTVRPRWTWIGLAVMISGLVLIAIGIIVQTWAWAVPGLAVLAVGGAAALYGGMFYDVQGGSSPRAQAREVVEGTEYEFPGAGTKRSQAEVERDVRRRWLRDR